MNEKEVNETYIKILRYFNTYTFFDDLLETRSYVSMDNIHDAILTVGIHLDQPFNYYIVKAKQFAINEHNSVNRKYRILVENFQRIVGGQFDFDVVGDYGFTDVELDLVLELLAGVKKYQSAIPRRQYTKILNNIKAKVKSAL